MSWSKLPSTQDSSVNFLRQHLDGKLEARFVQREADQFIVYLSSHTGCNKSCRFCHLTATKQVSFNPVAPGEYIEQAKTVLDHYDALTPIQKPTRLNYNWMARGEPLANPYMLKMPGAIIEPLRELAEKRFLTPAFKISTIMPTDVDTLALEEVFGELPIDFYYSMYSMDERFRKRWLPKSISPDAALDKLKDYQKATARPIWFHWAFIDGENDSTDDVRRILDAITARDLRARFNLVRYNPPNDRSKESPPEVIQRNFEMISEVMDNAQIVSRVGFDVKASCGMFVS